MDQQQLIVIQETWRKYIYPWIFWPHEVLQLRVREECWKFVVRKAFTDPDNITQEANIDRFQRLCKAAEGIIPPYLEHMCDNLRVPSKGDALLATELGQAIALIEHFFGRTPDWQSELGPRLLS